MYNIIKRLFDILFSFIVIILLLPIFIPIIIILLITGENEVFYFQKRVGLNNQEFGIFKFATMVKNSEKIGTGIYTAKNDKRILPFGKFLRKTKINELPQIFNIFLGQMSFVGPRPLILETYNFYSFDTQNTIGSLKPGLTGIGSIAFRDEGSILEKSKVDLKYFYRDNIAPKKGALECWYKQNISFKTDLLILLTTAYVIFFPKTKFYYKIFKNLPEI